MQRYKHGSERLPAETTAITRRSNPADQCTSFCKIPAPPAWSNIFAAHPHEGAVGVPAGERNARVIATGTSQTTGRVFNLAVAFERTMDADGNMLGRGMADSSFHHFADYNWDTDRGAPSFVTEPPGEGIRRERSTLDDIKGYVRNLAAWLAPSRRDAAAPR